MRLIALLMLIPVLAAPAVADVRLFRPLTADPHENQSSWRMSEYTEDWRYGTDVGDSTSRGGWIEDHQGVAWRVAAGEVFRWRPLERIGGWRGPWARYQVGVPAAMFAYFDTGALLDTDYQFGVSFDALWRGEFDPARGVTGFRRAVVTSRVRIMHRSTHLGDEYLALGAFGTNQDGQFADDLRFTRPPVKRVDLSYESADFVVSVERSRGDGAGTLRAYGGGEFKVRLPESWGIGGIIPRNLESPAWRLGLEYRSAGDADDPPDLAATRVLNRLVRSPSFETEWIAALDARIAKPFNFASSDNPTGETEVWTPYLWTGSAYGREYRSYATSWHGMLGLAIAPRGRRAAQAGGSRVGPEWIVALEWYRGYSTAGQFLDQRLRYRPRWQVLPSITAHF